MSGPNLTYHFPCPGCGESVALPPYSRLGWAGSSQFLHTAIWPILFLCPRYSFIREVPKSAVRLATELSIGQTYSMNSLWGIEGDCCLENCCKRHSIYSYGLKDSDPNSILHTFMSINPHIPCLGGHTAKFRREHLVVNRLTMS